MCIKHFQSVFHFWCLGFIFSFSQSQCYWILFLKGNKFKILNFKNNGWVYGICNIIKLFFLVLNYTRFWFELINQITFGIKLKIWPTSHFLSSSIWKWLFVKILIYHIFMVITLNKTHLWDEYYQNFHMAQTYCNHMESQCLINITNFIKIKNHSNHF
jgi:hypothetical protein